MAVYVSNPAGRLGRYYSRGKSLSEVVPMSATEAFETLTGVSDVKKEARMSRLMKKTDLQRALLEMEQEDLDIVFESQSETTANILVEDLFKKTPSGHDVKKVSWEILVILERERLKEVCNFWEIVSLVRNVSNVSKESLV